MHKSVTAKYVSEDSSFKPKLEERHWPSSQPGHDFGSHLKRVGAELHSETIM